MIDRISGIASRFVPSPAVSTPPARGVRYFELVAMLNSYSGKINTFEEGRLCKKHIVARRTSFGSRLFQIYTYHFPTHWSEGCIANRNLIKEAQRRAHALEHDHSLAALEWRTRFLKHYYNVFIGGAKPEPGIKPYSRFYQYVFVVIYRELKAAQTQALEAAKEQSEAAHANAIAKADEVSFEPVLDHSFSPVSRRLLVPQPDFDTLHRHRIAVQFADISP